MKEAYIAYIWKFRLYQHQNLNSTKGESIEVLNPGILNNDAGPDFFNAKIKIGSTIWAGNVEIHQKASDWEAHHHDQDNAYENVILHLIYEHDKEIHRKDGSLIPALELKSYLNIKIEQNFLYLFHNQAWIPCEKRIASVDSFLIENFLDRLSVERLEQKVQPILAKLKHHQNDWETTFYHSLMRSFGLRVNKEAFELLAQQLPLSILLKHRNDLFQVEALLFGVAGLLEENHEAVYFQELKKEFAFLQKKFDLKPINPIHWKFARLRPANFPTIRLAQFAQLIHQKEKLFADLLELKNIEDFYEFFQITLGGFWETHYHFKKESKPKTKRLGKTAIHLFLINTIIPFLFLYGKQIMNASIENRSLDLLQSLPRETNKIIEQWLDLKVPCQNAFQSQALLQLKNEYCDNKRCLECNIGHQILKE